MTLSEVRKEVHTKYLKMRNLNRIILSDVFAEAYEKATERQQSSVHYFIYTEDAKKIRAWIHSILGKDLDLKSVRDLRKIASQLRIKDYGNLAKDEIIQQIREIEKEYTNDDAKDRNG